MYKTCLLCTNWGAGEELFEWERSGPGWLCPAHKPAVTPVAVGGPVTTYLQRTAAHED
jgi:hypothetical protein